VLVTRAAEQAAELSQALREAGFEPVEVPLIEIRPVALDAGGRRALAPGRRYQLMALASVNAARYAVQAASAAGSTLADLIRGGIVVAVGEATAAEVIRLGIAARLDGSEGLALGPPARADQAGYPAPGGWLRLRVAAQGEGGADLTPPPTCLVVAPRANAEGILEALAGLDLRGLHALVPRAREGRETVVDGLRARDVAVEPVAVYETLPRDAAGIQVRSELEKGLAAIVLMNPIAARALRDAVPLDETLPIVPPGAPHPAAEPVADSSLGSVAVVCSGETTAEAARRLGFAPVISARDQSAGGVVAALSDHLGMSAAPERA
jgi:uroporphyrinogen-III synthase